MTLSFRQSFEELEGKCKRPAKMANLAFDGRRKSFRTPALPAIVSHRMTATVSVVVGAIGGVNRWGLPHGSLRRDLVSGVGPRGISDAGMELESNGLVHRNLTACSGLELVEESASSKREMARSMGIPILAFSYPYGAFSKEHFSYLIQAGYSGAVSVFPDEPTVTHDRYAMRRVYIHAGDVAWRFSLKLSSLYLRYRARQGHKEAIARSGKC